MFAKMRTVVFTILAILRLAQAADPAEIESAGIDAQAKAAYFVLASEGYVFALNVADNGDVYYHMNAPSKHSWMGVGFGSSTYAWKRAHIPNMPSTFTDREL